MRRVVAVPLLLLGLAVSACGGSEPAPSGQPSAPTTSTTATSAAAQTATTANAPQASDDAAQIAEAYKRYRDAVLARDWATTCDSITPDGRTAIRAAGAGAGLDTPATCTQVLENLGETLPQPREADLSGLAVNGSTAIAENAFPPSDGRPTSAAFAKDGDRWLVQTNTP